MKRSEPLEFFLNYRLVGWGPVIAILSAIGGWPLCVAFALLWPKEFGFAYFTVLSFFGTLALGALFWVLLHYAVDAAWSVFIRRIWEHLACLLMPLVVFSVPLIFFRFHLWEHWENSMTISPGLQWLVPVGFLLLLAGSASWLRRISVREDGGHPRWVVFASIPCYAFGFTLISIFAWMPLQGEWISAIWPLYFFAGAALSSLAVSILIVVWVLPGFHQRIKPDHFHLLGKLLFAFTLFWGYVAFSQYLIVWYGNLPEETAFFRLRQQGWAQVAGWLLIVGHFLIPFFLLLPRASKARPKFLAAVSAWLVLMQFVDLCWMILPPSHNQVLLGALALLISLAAVGGTLILCFLAWLGNSPLWPVADHRLAECLSLTDE